MANIIVWQQTCTRMQVSEQDQDDTFSQSIFTGKTALFFCLRTGTSKLFSDEEWVVIIITIILLVGPHGWRLLANLSGVFLNNSIKNSLLEIQSFPSMELCLGVLLTGYHLMGTHSAKGHWSIYTTVFISWNLYFYFAPKQLMRFISNQKVGKRMNPCDSYLCMF